MLALSQNEVRLIHGDRFSLQEIESENLPGSLAGAMKYDDIEKQLQLHSAAPAGMGKGAVFHGHDVSDDDKDRILRYFRLIDAGMKELLKEKPIPLLLAGVEYLGAIYQAANSYANLLPEVIPGNPERLRPEELHQQAWEIIEPHFRRERVESVGLYRELTGTGRTTAELPAVVRASRNGRIDTLFIPVGQRVWGSIDPHEGTVHMVSDEDLNHEYLLDHEDLLDHAAIQTFLNGGAVYAVSPAEVPDAAPAAAIFRW